MAPRRATYTALLGGYEKLIEQPVAESSEVDFICFTDDPSLTSTGWDVRLISPLLARDMFRSQRALKIRGDDQLAGYDETLYIDNSVFLREDPAVILDRWLADGDLALSPHSFRDRVIDEFDEVLELGYDDAHRVHEQLLYYAELFPDVLLERPTWNGMIARRDTPDVRKGMGLWFDHVLRFSRRDQLSANVAFAAAGIDVTLIDENNNDSPSHQWPAGVQRKAQLTKIGQRRLGPPIAEIARLHREIDGLRPLAQAWVDGQDEFERRRHELEAQIASLTLRVGHADAEAARARAEADGALDSAEELRHTLSWRITAPLRAARGVVKR